MKCLYCGEPLALALLKRFTGGGEFCSDACKANYQAEFTQLAVGRLQQARRRPGASFSVPDTPLAPAPEPLPDALPPPLPPPAPETAFRDVAARLEQDPRLAAAAWQPAEPPAIAVETAVAVEDPPAPPEPEAVEEPVAILEPEFVAESPAWAGSPVQPDPEPLPEPEPEPVPEPEPDLPRGGFVGFVLRALDERFAEHQPPVRPAPVTVYLQFPLDLQRSRLRRPSLAACPPVEGAGLEALRGREIYGRTPAVLEGFHLVLKQGLRQLGRRIRLPRALAVETALAWSAPALAEPLAMGNLVFAPRGLGFTAVTSGDLPPEDARFDQFLRPATREEMLRRIRQLRRSQPLAESVTASDGTPITLEQVKPAMELLKSIGETLATQAPAAGDSAPDPAALVPWSGASAAPRPPAMPLPAPVVDPAFGPPAPLANRPAPAAPAAPPASGGPALPPGLVGPNAQAFLFGTELAVTAAAAPAAEAEPLAELAPVSPAFDAEPVPAPLPAAPSSTNTNVNQMAGFGPPSGGSMNIGTMVVVNQPSGAVTINAASPTAATFEARLKPKEPGPLSSISEPAGLQIPARPSAETLPLRMNFAGSLGTAVPIHWPVLSTATLRRKFFFGPPPKSTLRRPETLATPPPKPSGSRLPEPPPMPAAASSRGASPAEEQGAIGWLKSLSGRFARK